MRKAQQVECIACEGNGTIFLPRHGSVICRTCNGLGEIIIPKQVGVPSRDKFLDD